LKSDGSVVHSDYLARPVTAPIGFSRRINRGDTAAGVMTAALRSPISLSAACNFTVTNTNDSGPGSLRQAVADAAGCSSTDIGIAVSGTITLASRILINSSVDINGPGMANLTISGNNSTRIFFVGTGTTAPFSGTVTLHNMTLANGFGKGGDSSSGGGGAGMGGAIFQNGGNLSLSNVLLLGNRALGGSRRGGVDSGGGFGGDAIAGHGADGGDLGGLGGADGSGPAINGGPGGVGGGGGVGGRGNEQTPAGKGGNGGFGGGGGAGGFNDFRDASVGGDGGDGGFGGGAAIPLGPGGTSGESGFGGALMAGAGFGGAVFARSGSLAFTNTYFEDNSGVGGSSIFDGAGKGGGLFLYQPNSGGVSATATASTVCIRGAAATAARTSVTIYSAIRLSVIIN